MASESTDPNSQDWPLPHHPFCQDTPSLPGGRATRIRRREAVIAWKDFLRFALREARTTTERLAAAPSPLQSVGEVVLTDEVSRTLFEEYAAHRSTERGTEETGWVLLGHREASRAVVLATLPAGAERDAGREHVRFNAEAQALASRIVRQADKRLSLLGVVHTHPGTLRHPSSGDFRGDREWVQNLRGGEGIFGIGTVADRVPKTGVAIHPQPQTLQYADLRFDWYTLAEGEKKYRPVPVELTIGPDLAKPLRKIWTDIENHAVAIDRLARQLTNVQFEVGESLNILVGLAANGQLRACIEGKSVRFFYEVGEDAFQIDLPAGTRPDQGIYLILAELAVRG